MALPLLDFGVDFGLESIKADLYLHEIDENSSFESKFLGIVPDSDSDSPVKKVRLSHAKGAKESAPPAKPAPSSPNASMTNASPGINTGIQDLLLSPIGHTVTKADSAAAFVASHEQEIHTTMESMGYKGEYEVLVGLIGHSAERIIILFSHDMKASSRSLAQQLKWITHQFQCSLFTPSASLHLPDGWWKPYKSNLITSKSLSSKTLRHLLQVPKPHRQNLGQEPPLAASVPNFRAWQIPPPGDASDSQREAGPSGNIGKSRTPLAGATKGKGKALVNGASDEIRNPKRSQSSSDKSASRRDSGNSRGDPESFGEGEYGEGIKGLQFHGFARFTNAPQTGSGRDIDEVIDLQMNFDFAITIFEKPHPTKYTIPGSNGLYVENFWTIFDIQHCHLNNNAQLPVGSQSARYYVQEFVLSTGTTPLAGVPIPIPKWKASFPHQVHVKTERSKGTKGTISAAMSPHEALERSSANANSIEVDRECIQPSVGAQSNRENNRKDCCYKWEQLQADHLTDKTFRLEGRSAPATVFDYRRVEDVSQVTAANVTMEATWTVLPDERTSMGPWLLQRFQEKSRKKLLHSNLIHTVTFDVDLAAIPDGQPDKTIMPVDFAAAEPEGIQVAAIVGSKDGLRYSEVQPSPALSLPVVLGQSIHGETTKGKSLMKAFREKVSGVFKRSGDRP